MTEYKDEKNVYDADLHPLPLTLVACMLNKIIILPKVPATPVSKNKATTNFLCPSNEIAIFICFLLFILINLIFVFLTKNNCIEIIQHRHIHPSRNISDGRVFDIFHNLEFLGVRIRIFLRGFCMQGRYSLFAFGIPHNGKNDDLGFRNLVLE